MPESVYESIKRTGLPAVLYGTGNAADRIKELLDINRIEVSGIFASDGFVRKRQYMGFDVLSYSEAKERFGRMAVVLCFGSERPEVIDNFKRIDAEQELFAPDIPVAGGENFSGEFYEKNRERFDAVRSALADAQSRLVFDKVLEYRFSGRIAPLTECSTDTRENWKLLCEGLADKAPVLLDLGAYTGDTAMLFAETVSGNYTGIIAVEPGSRNFRKLSENTEGLERVSLIRAAVSDRPGTAAFLKGGGRGGFAGAVQRTEEVPLIRVDMIDEYAKLARCAPGIIKMDLEGSELKAIDGARPAIAATCPRMMIAAYHRTEDILAIPERVLAIRPDYRLYLRKDPGIPAWGINCIFV